MGYPTSVPALGSANTGDVVQAAHVNDLRTEVTNLADGLLNGLQHALTVSTGGLTVSTGNTILGQNLSVAGGSTLAAGLTVSTGATILGGTLQVNGTSTFTGAVTFTGGVNPPRVRVGIAADQNVANAAWTGLNWVTEEYDSDGMHSTSASSSRLTCVASSGVYHFGAAVNFTNASSGIHGVRILLGDSTASMVAAQFTYFAAALVSAPVSVCGDMRVADTATYATVQVYQGSGSTNSITSTGQYVTAFWAHRVS